MKSKLLAGFIFVPAICATALGLVGAGQSAKTYIYVLKPVPRLLVLANWTDADKEIVDEHLAYLKNLQTEGRLIIAGKTDGLDEKTFGIAVFEAESPAAAEKTMKDDPAVKNGLMTAELFPYTVALERSRVK